MRRCGTCFEYMETWSVDGMGYACCKKCAIEIERLKARIESLANMVVEEQDALAKSDVEVERLKVCVKDLEEALRLKGMSIGLFTNSEALEIHQEELRQKIERIEKAHLETANSSQVFGPLTRVKPPPYLGEPWR